MVSALVVEDDPDISGFLEVVLADGGKEAQGCASGEEAWKARPLDLVLLDWVPQRRSTGSWPSAPRPEDRSWRE